MIDGGRGKLVVIAAPSGAGKTTLVHALLERESSLEFSISYTTRPRRAAEVDGADYFFVDAETFEAMRQRGEFLESARVFDHCYGTSRAYIERMRAQGKTILLEIDWQGAQQVRANDAEAVSVIVLPPGRGELERRLRGRGTDSESVVERRLADAVGDMSHWQEFDYAVVNDDLASATDALAAILQGRGERFATTEPATVARVQRILAG